MATHPGQRPKRKDYATKLFYEIAVSTWETMSGLYRMDRERERQERQAQRQRDREARIAQAKKAGKVAKTVIATAAELYGAVQGPPLIAGGLSGYDDISADFQRRSAASSQYEERAERSQQMDRETRDKGNRSGWSSGQ